MKLSKNFNIIFAALLFYFTLFSSCKKDDDNKSEPDQGKVKVTVMVNLDSATGCDTYYLQNDLKVDLINLANSADVRTQYSKGNGENNEFVKVPYGDYQVLITGKVMHKNSCNNDVSVQHIINESDTITVSGPTHYVTFSI